MPNESSLLTWPLYQYNSVGSFFVQTNAPDQFQNRTSGVYKVLSGASIFRSAWSGRGKQEDVWRPSLGRDSERRA